MLGRAANLAGAREKGEDRACGIPKCPMDDVRHVLFETVSGLSNIDGLDGMLASRTFQYLALKMARELFGIQCGRHGHDAEIWSQNRLGFLHEGQAQIIVQPPLVNFVEKNRADSVKLR